MLETTAPGALDDWESFFQAYHEPICCVLRHPLGVPESEVDDLAQSFFAKLIEKDVLKQAPTVPGQFRKWLFAALRNHVVDTYRRAKRACDRGTWVPGLEPEDTRPESPDGDLDADSLYALCALNLTLQKMRFHCESSGKPEVWTIFEKCILAAALHERGDDAYDALLEQFPGRGRQDLYNLLATAKRIFQRMLPEFIPPALTDRVSHRERFEEWIQIFRSSRAGQRNRLHLAFCVTPAPTSDASHYSSAHMAQRPDPPPGLLVEPLPRELAEDELRILLHFRLAMPLEDYLGPYDGGRRKGRTSTSAPGARRNLLSLIDPPPGPIGDDLPGLLNHIRKRAKWIHKNPAHEMPPEVSKIIYNLAVVLARLRLGATISSLDDAQFRKNLEWALALTWLDDRLRRVFREGLDVLGPSVTA